MSSLTLSELRAAHDVAITAATRAGDRLIKMQSEAADTVERKQGLDIVTDADRAAERIVLEHISAAYPMHRLDSEERGAAGPAHSPNLWIVDPLDGTINYTSGLAFYTTSIALLHEGVPVVGVVNAPALGQIFSAMAGQGATVNHSVLTASSETRLADAVVSFMLTSHYEQALRDWTLAVVAELAPRVRGLRLLVSQALELAFIAAGQLQGSFCNRTHGTSSAAGTLLVAEAGGIVVDLDGRPYMPGASTSLVAASTPALSEQLLAYINMIPQREDWADGRLT